MSRRKKGRNAKRSYDTSSMNERTTHADLSVRIEIKKEDFLYDVLKEKSDPLFLVLDCVQDPHNFGACLRTADAAGVDAVIAPRDRSASITDTVRRIACGGAENVNIVFVVNLARVLGELHEEGVRFIGTSDAGDAGIYDADLTGPLGIVVGGEGPGMRRLTMERCDQLVQIPMHGEVECLNVSVAAGVCLYEAVRQRR
jgi:23S rRNA (guanosine2251-2'-O)-methyltransferase